MQIKIVSYNIQFGRGLDGVVDLVRTCRALRGADIVCLQEVDQFWKRSGNQDQAAEITALMPTYYTAYGSSFDVDASVGSAHGAVVNRRRRHGNMILSRWPILSCRCFNLPKWNYADEFNMQMTCLETVIDTGAAAMRVYSYHAGYLQPPERIEQTREFAAVFARSPAELGAWSGASDIDGDDWSNGHASPPMPATALVCGDFNANPDSDEYRLLLDETGLIDCWALADPANQRSSTLWRETSDDALVSGKIDQVLVTADLADGVATVEIDETADASDHKPLRVVLTL